jgi:outer membrane receptor protein involved in Fe transport
LKLRGSWGRVGNTGVSDFASLSLFGSGLYGSTPTWAFAQAGNPNLRWEQSTKVDVGISYGLFKDRITGELNYYQNNITDLVLAEPQAPSRGVPNNSINTNVGSMVNKGFEFTLNALVLEKKISLGMLTLISQLTQTRFWHWQTTTLTLLLKQVVWKVQTSFV